MAIIAPEDPHHSIIDKPWKWSVVGFNYVRDMGNGLARLDLTLEKAGARRCFRFTAPQDLRFESGFPATPGLVFLDISARGLDRLKVRVADFEAGPGGLFFYAADVTEVPAEGPAA